MAINGIAQSKPALGGVVSSITPSVVIAPVSADRPYILGSVVVGITPTASTTPAKAFVGQPEGEQKIQGVMCLGSAQVAQRGENGFVKAGFADDYNNFGTKGAFWCALDLAHFTKSDVEGVGGKGVLSVDKNGVLSFGKTNVQNNTSAGGTDNNVVIGNDCVSVLNFYDKAIIGAIDESVAVGAETYAFKYPKGIGAILVIVK